MVNLNLIRPEHLWYTVGLITSDGNLSKDGRHINITSKDKSLLDGIKQILKVNIKLQKKGNGKNSTKRYHFLQLGDVNFYNFLVQIGLTPKKSLTLKSIKIPTKYFNDFLRGVIDGDGSISNWVNNQNGNIQWSLRIVSGSKTFLAWLMSKIETNFKILGKLYISLRPLNSTLYTLKFGKIAAKNLISICYYKNCFGLQRKILKAQLCINTPTKLKKYGIHFARVA